MLYVLGLVSQECAALVELGVPSNCSLTQACHPHKGQKTADMTPCMTIQKRHPPSILLENFQDWYLQTAWNGALWQLWGSEQMQPLIS